MYCYQCEQTAKGSGCVVQGICGKNAEVAALQDLLVHVAKELSRYAHRLRGFGKPDQQAEAFILELLFSTVTNVDFDPDRLEVLLRQAQQTGGKLKDAYEQACRSAGEKPEALCTEDCRLPETREGLLEQAQQLQIDKHKAADGEDVVGLQELILYGLKGAASYADHARLLGVTDQNVYATFDEILDFLAGNPKDIENFRDS